MFCKLTAKVSTQIVAEQNYQSKSSYQLINPPSVSPSQCPHAVTWSKITDSAGDQQCPSHINHALNEILTGQSIEYSINGGYTYTTKKIDPYTAIETNDSTKQQKTLKSSVSNALTHGFAFAISFTYYFCFCFCFYFYMYYF